MSDEIPDRPPEQEEAAAHVAERVVRFGLTTPTVFFLETVRPMNQVGAQAMHFLSPFAGMLVGAKGWDHFARYLQDRGSIEDLIERIEAHQAGADAARADG